MPFVMVPVHFKEYKSFHSFAGRDGVSYEIQQFFFSEIHMQTGVVVIVASLVKANPKKFHYQD